MSALVVTGCFDPTSLDEGPASGDATGEASADASAGSDGHEGANDDANDGASDQGDDPASDEADDAASEDADDGASDDADGAASDEASDDTTGAAGDDATGDASADASAGASDDAAETTGEASASASDDGASDDGTVTSGAEPDAPALRVFVTSGAFPTNFGGALGADELCQSVADDAGLVGTFRAWVSDSMTSPLARFQHADGPYALLDGTVLAADWDDLVDGQIAIAIGITESGAPVDPPSTIVATATTEGGTLQPFNGSCADWTTTSNAQSFGVGNEENMFTWSDSGAAGCNTLVSLYCFEQ